jgi:hypothetical protein
MNNGAAILREARRISAEQVEEPAFRGLDLDIVFAAARRFPALEHGAREEES